MMQKSLFKEKAYKLLYENYSRLYTRILMRAKNAKEYGQKDDQLQVIETIIDETQRAKAGICSKEEDSLIKTLEYLINDDEPVK